MVAQDDVESWRAEAKREQCEFYTSWGHKVVWRGIPTESTHSLQLSIAHLLFHKTPTNAQQTVRDLGLSRQEVATATIIANKIVKFFQDQFVHMKVLFVSAHWRGNVWGEIVFRLEGGGDTKFIDHRFRVYHDWESFLNGTKIPPSHMCYPTSGRYALAPNGMEVLISFGCSPSSKTSQRVLAKAKLIAYVCLLVGLIFDAIYAFQTDLFVLMIVGSCMSIAAALFLCIMAAFKFFQALKYS